jgi:hypothetical protein
MATEAASGIVASYAAAHDAHERPGMDLGARRAG